MAPNFSQDKMIFHFLPQEGYSSLFLRKSAITALKNIILILFFYKKNVIALAQYLQKFIAVTMYV